MAGGKDRTLKVSATEALKKSPNEMHRHHRLSASGTGPHRNRKRYCRKRKHRKSDGED